MTQAVLTPQGKSDPTASESGTSLPAANGPQIEEVLEHFIEQMGLCAQLDGVPRIAGRIAGYFIVHGGPVSFGQLAEALQVSRGSISTNVRMLVSIGLIERAAVPGDRQDYYQITRSPFHRMIDAHLERLRRVWHIVDSAYQALAGQEPGAAQETQTRLQEMNRFYREAVKSNEALLARLSKDET